MNISIVNANNTRIKYVIDEKSALSSNILFNFSASSLFVKNDYSDERIEITKDNFSYFFPDKFINYNVFFNCFNLIPTIEAISVEENFYNSLSALTLFSFNPNTSAIFVNLSEIGFEISGNVFPYQIDESNYCSKDEFDETFDDKIELLSSFIDDFKFIVNDGFAKGTYDLCFPKLPESSHFEFVPDDFSLIIPEIEEQAIPQIQSSIQILDKMKNEDFDFSFSLSSLFLTRNKVVNNLENLENELNSLSSFANRIDNFKRGYKIKFSCMNKDTNEFFIPDIILINDNEIEFSVNENECFVSGFISDLDYKLTITKSGMLDVNKKFTTFITDNFNDSDWFDTGIFKVDEQSKFISFILTWGLTPKDLDFHVYSFDSNFESQLEHVSFNNPKSYESQIFFNNNSTKSYGSEIIKIFKLDKEKYYLFSIHNMSYERAQLFSDMNMNKDGNTKISIHFKNNCMSIFPDKITSSKSVSWWDGFIIHNENIYVINSYADYRKYSEFDFNNDLSELNALKNKLSNCKTIIPFRQIVQNESLNNS